MAVNLDKPQNWKNDILKSVDMYNDWFMKSAPSAFRSTRINTSKEVEQALKDTDYLRDVSPAIFVEFPAVILHMRMCCCPPLARDRIIGLADVSGNLVKSMEGAGGKPKRIPPRMKAAERDAQLTRIGNLIEKLADEDIFPWLARGDDPTEAELVRASAIVADRVCGSLTDPIIRNAQEKRQLKVISDWLNARGYKQLPPKHGMTMATMPPGTYTFRMNIPVNGGVNIPVDAVVKPLKAKPADLPVLLEAKSAGDFTNVNKRRKEEAKKASQLQDTYGKSIQFHLFLCGYFNPGYLGYGASDGTDWVWEHRVDDLAGFGL